MADGRSNRRSRFAGWQNRSSSAGPHDGGVGGGLPHAGEPTVRQRRFAVPSRTRRRTREGRLRTCFGTHACHAAQGRGDRTARPPRRRPASIRRCPESNIDAAKSRSAPRRDAASARRQVERFAAGVSSPTRCRRLSPCGGGRTVRSPLPLRRVAKQVPPARVLTMAASVGVCRPPVSRLSDSGVCRSPSAYSSPTPQGTPPDLFWYARVSRGSRSRRLDHRPPPPASSRLDSPAPINIGAAKSRRPRDAMRPARGDRSKNSLQAFRAAAALFRQRRPRNPTVRVIVH